MEALWEAHVTHVCASVPETAGNCRNDGVQLHRVRAPASLAWCGAWRLWSCGPSTAIHCRLLALIAFFQTGLHDCHQLRLALLPCKVEDGLALLFNLWVRSRINQHLRDDGIALQDGER